MTAHTPGPWSAVRHGSALYVTGSDAVCSITCEIREYPDESCAESHANASLIVAAPDLLDALKAMVWIYDGVRDALTCPTVIAKLAAADAAIAKAEGRS